MKTIQLNLLFILVLFCASLIPFISFAAAPAVSSLETVANTTVGAANNQTAFAATTTANVAEVKATRTLTVGALPGNAETITIGSCVVTFSTTASSTSDELNCSDNVAA